VATTYFNHNAANIVGITPPVTQRIESQKAYVLQDSEDRNYKRHETERSGHPLICVQVQTSSITQQ